jgi:YidC/Oxa1 family membrane protein insertase
VVFVVILYRYPAGLLVYWITTNLWTIAQQYLIKRHMGPPPAPIAADGSSNGKSARVLKPALAGVGGAGSGGGSGGGGAGLLGKLAGSPPPPKEAESKPAAPPPRSPRSKKKKRSGRRR